MMAHAFLYAFIWGLGIGLVGMVAAYKLGRRDERRRVLRILDRDGGDLITEALRRRKMRDPLAVPVMFDPNGHKPAGDDSKTIKDCALRFGGGFTGRPRT